MQIRKFYLFLIICFSNGALLASDKTQNISYVNQTLNINEQSFLIKIPSRYKLELLNDSLVKPRLLTFLPNNELLIGSKSGHIYRLHPPYTQFISLLELEDYPHSITFRNNQLFIAQTNGLYVIDYIPGQKKLDKKQLKLISPLPTGGHSSRTVRVGPDNIIYLSIGISGNCSNEYLHKSYSFQERRGGIFYLDESVTPNVLTPYASGLRNPVGFDWHPETGEMYASNNGPDHWGFNYPPEYFSRIRKNSFHGMPWYQYTGLNFQRDTCIKQKPPLPITEVVAPAVTFPARNAPMSVSFVHSGDLDSRFTFDAIVALRGSWGKPDTGSYQQRHAARRQPKIVLVQFIDGKAVQTNDLISGFQLSNGDRWARPVGTALGPDHNLYFTSDSGINGLFRLVKINN